MPVTLTYPGVYVEEIPSGVRTITGVATSITAFIGRALRGPLNKATTINSYADFERIFGGLWAESTLGYAVRDFYLNGGQQAIIVRLYHPESGQGAKPSKSRIAAGTVTLEAAYEGAWGANLRAVVDTNVSQEVAARMGLAKTDLFNLTVRDAGPSGLSERYLNLSFKESPRRVDRVLQDESKLARWDPAIPFDPANPPAIAAAMDAVTTAEQALADAKKTYPPVASAIAAAEAALEIAQGAMDSAVSDGLRLTKTDDFTPANALDNKKGLYALEQADLFNLLCIPPYKLPSPSDPLDVDTSLISDAASYCEGRRAMLLVDAPIDWTDKISAKAKFTDPDHDHVGTRSKNAALFFPRLK